MGLLEPALGRIELASPLLADYLPLHLDLMRIEPHAVHPVGLDRQGELPAVRRKREPVVRAILARLGVGLPAREQDQPVDLPLGKALGPFEEHVLDEVGQTREPRRLVERPHRIIQVADDDRGASPRQHQDLEAVGQGPLGNRKVVVQVI